MARCKCYFGQNEDGCTAEPDKAEFELQFYTDGLGQVACKEGTDVVYPDGAPGFVYDPTGRSDKNR